MVSMGLSKHIPAKNLFFHEKNTYAVDKNGEYKLTGEVDFYINNDLQWALELVRNDDSIGSHMGRFDSRNGKNRGLQPKAFLVVDCRPCCPPTTSFLRFVLNISSAERGPSPLAYSVVHTCLQAYLASNSSWIQQTLLEQTSC
jgi:hypothetical protein